MRRYTVVITSVAILALWAGCDLLTGPNERFIGVIGYEPAADTKVIATEGSSLTHVVAFAAAPADTLPPWCPDHVHSYNPDCPMLDAPDTVDAGAPFDITVRTSAPDGCNAPDGADVSVTDTMIEVVPYDRKTGPGCADAVGMLPHLVELTFPEPGDALLRITGRILIVGDSVVDERMGSVDHPIVVR